MELARRSLERSLIGVVGLKVVREPRPSLLGRWLPTQAWPISQVMHALALTDPWLGPQEFGPVAAGLELYRHGAGYRDAPVTGTRYYDDNAWLGLAFLQHSRLTSTKSSYRAAKRLDAFVHTGFDPVRGGVLWVEGGSTVNACSTGSAAVLGAGLGRDVSGHVDLMARLRDDRGLVRDHIRADGSIDGRVFTYNQGLLVAAALDTGAGELAEEAATAAVRGFGDDDWWRQPLAFNAILAKALWRADVGRAVVAAYAERLWREGRDERGWFTRAGRYDSGFVLDAAAALQVFAVVDGVADPATLL